MILAARQQQMFEAMPSVGKEIELADDDDEYEDELEESGEEEEEEDDSSNDEELALAIDRTILQD